MTYRIFIYNGSVDEYVKAPNCDVTGTINFHQAAEWWANNRYRPANPHVEVLDLMVTRFGHSGGIHTMKKVVLKREALPLPPWRVYPAPPEQDACDVSEPRDDSF